MSRSAADGSQPGRQLRTLATLAGIIGPVLLIAYFVIPELIGWPSAGESAGKLAAYASAHRHFFYLGGWLQATGALLSVAFLLVLLQVSGARRTLAGSATLVGCAVLLAGIGFALSGTAILPRGVRHNSARGLRAVPDRRPCRGVRLGRAGVRQRDVRSGGHLDPGRRHRLRLSVGESF